ncbi:MAG: hypothetical protein WAX77_01195 [Methylococcaceae bacterium]
MPIDILLTVVAISIIQSIFGVGTLLFGTPILLLLGYDFINTLEILLPVSIAISVLQIIRHHEEIDLPFYRNLLIYSIPLVVVFLVVITMIRLNISALVGGLLIFVALKSFLPFIEKLLTSIVRYEKLYLMLMGIIHGISNLGGSLLTVIIYAKSYSKNKLRVTSAVSYATLALFQLVTLLIVGVDSTISYSDRASFVQIGIILFLLTEEIIYSQIDNEKYSKLFAIFLFISGILLIIKSL